MSGISKAYLEPINEIDDMVNAEIKKGNEERNIVYSAYDVDEFDVPINNLNEVPVKGKIKFVNEDKTWESEIYDSPTWLQIAVIANEMINETQDYMHVYLEDIDVIKNNGDFVVARFFMGS